MSLKTTSNIRHEGIESKMNEKPRSEDLLTMYLLGELPEQEQARIEEVFFADDAYYEQLLIAEDELRCDYAGGLLDPRRRAAFEKRFSVSQADRNRLAFAAALVSTLSPPSLEPTQAAPKVAGAPPSVKVAGAPPSVFEVAPPLIKPWNRLSGTTSVVPESPARPGPIGSLGRRLRLPDRLAHIGSLIPRIKLERVEQPEPEPSASERPLPMLERFARIALAFLAIVLIAGVAMIIAQTIRYQNQVRDLERELGQQKGLIAHNEEEKKRTEELTTNLDEKSRDLTAEGDTARPNKQPSPKVDAPDATAATASFILSSEMKKPLLQPGEAERVRIQLNLKKPDAYQSYEALLKTGEGRLVWGQAGLRPNRFGPIRVVAVTMLARVVPPGDYHVELKGIAPGKQAEQVDDYFFSVAQK